MATKRGRKWQVALRFEGELVRRSFDTEREAEYWLAQAKAARDAGLPLPDAKGASGKTEHHLKPFIDDVFRDLFGGNADVIKYEYMRDELVGYFGADKLLAKITTADVDKYSQWLEEEKRNGSSTINRKLSFLSKILRKAASRELIDKMPVITRRKGRKGRKRFLTAKEERDMLKTFRELGFEESYWRCAFMIYTGARDGEVRNLQWTDIDGRKVTLDGKTGHRTLVMPERAMEAIRWSREQGNLRPFPISYEQFKSEWDTVAERLGLSEDRTWVPYVMRHTCASRLVQRGVDLRRVKDWMGHSTIHMTMNYAHLAPRDLDVCAEALDA